MPTVLTHLHRVNGFLGLGADGDQHENGCQIDDSGEWGASSHDLVIPPQGA
jgi:hypothetical protein